MNKNTKIELKVSFIFILIIVVYCFISFLLNKIFPAYITGVIIVIIGYVTGFYVLPRFIKSRR